MPRWRHRRFASRAIGAEVEEVAASAVLAIGHTPNTAFLDGQARTGQKGLHYLDHGRPGRTPASKAFRGRRRGGYYYRQAVTAAGTGCMAAWMRNGSLGIMGWFELFRMGVEMNPLAATRSLRSGSASRCKIAGRLPLRSQTEFGNERQTADELSSDLDFWLYFLRHAEKMD